ncbi:MAG: hypothetical protein OH316_00545 [Candidatus Parvarchaeota archaeon]|nr:hypothetical protein [Candidatus Parvarchaeota archaeon]
MTGIKPSGLEYNLTMTSHANIKGEEPGITQENQPYRRRIDRYADDISRQLNEDQRIGDILTGPEIAGLYIKVQEPKAAQMGQENAIIEHQRLTQIEERSLVFPESCGGLPLIDFVVRPYVDSSNNRVYYNDPETGKPEPLVTFWALYGYRFYNRKPEYGKNMYEEMFRIADRASDVGLNIGSVKRDLVNAHIINDSFEVRGYSHYRINGSDDYESLHIGSSYEKKETIPEKAVNALYNLLKGTIVGPRTIIFSKRPVRVSQLELLLKALSDEDHGQKVSEMENI